MAGIDPARTAFFEDSVKNLAAAKTLGMTTVLVQARSRPRVLFDTCTHTRSTNRVHESLTRAPPRHPFNKRRATPRERRGRATTGSYRTA